MLFNSAEYLFLFLPFSLLLYHFLRGQTAKVLVLVLLSLYFYMVAYPAYILVLLGLIAVDFGAALWMDRLEGIGRKSVLVLALAANLGLLAVFKYYNFFAENLAFLGPELPRHSWMLPVGLSFHTFQSMSYLLEVYRRAFPCERNLGQYSLYVLFFPQMVAGPIERPQNILPQLKTLPGFRPADFRDGMFQLARGLFMKVVVADRLTLLVDPVFKSPEKAGSTAAGLAILFFALQIYADFSGYSNMALGAARMMGIRLMTNFRQPYLADSLGDFWRRWHISLSTWFRDYLYFPLGGSRDGRWKTVRNMLVIFGLSGLWHGAGWNFLVWGLLHGLGLSLEHLAGPPAEGNIYRILRQVRTLGWVLLCWVFFRASSFGNAVDVLRTLFAANFRPLAFSPAEVAFGLCMVLLVPLAERWRMQERLYERTGWVFIVSLFVLAYFLGNFNATSFIYFQF